MHSLYEVHVLTCRSTTLCLLHRAHMPPAGSEHSKLNAYPEDMAYPSRNIAYQAAGMITAIIESLEMHDELRFTPAFMYVIFDSDRQNTRLIILAVSIACFPP